jgi:hypothetical protein
MQLAQEETFEHRAQRCLAGQDRGGKTAAIGGRSGDAGGGDPGVHAGYPVSGRRSFSFPFNGNDPCRSTTRDNKGGTNRMSILWIILIVILVLALLGFFSRGYW